jgi:hypothetical protein
VFIIVFDLKAIRIFFVLFLAFCWSILTWFFIMIELILNDFSGKNGTGEGEELLCPKIFEFFHMRRAFVLQPMGTAFCWDQ